MSVTLQIELPDDVYRALVAQSNRHAAPVRKIVAAAVTRSVRAMPEPVQKAPTEVQEPETDIEHRIAELNAKGVSDRAIAEDLAMSREGVRRIRADVLGLPVVGKPGRKRADA